METSVAVVAILGMLVSFGLPLALVALVLAYKHRKLRMSHETIARLAAKGLPGPPEPIEPPRPRRRHLARRGGRAPGGKAPAVPARADRAAGPARLGDASWRIGPGRAGD